MTLSYIQLPALRKFPRGACRGGPSSHPRAPTSPSLIASSSTGLVPTAQRQNVGLGVRDGSSDAEQVINSIPEDQRGGKSYEPLLGRLVQYLRGGMELETVVGHDSCRRRGRTLFRCP